MVQGDLTLEPSFTYLRMYIQKNFCFFLFAFGCNPRVSMFSLSGFVRRFQRSLLWGSTCAVATARWRRTDDEEPGGGAGARRGASGNARERTLPNPMGRHDAMPHIKTFLRYERTRGERKANDSNSSACDDSSTVSPGNGSAGFREGSPSSRAGEGARLAWVLVTSHNLSKTAWGEYQLGDSQLGIKSFELGVLLLPSLVGGRAETPFSCVGGGGGPKSSNDAARCLANVRPRPAAGYQVRLAGSLREISKMGEERGGLGRDFPRSLASPKLRVPRPLSHEYIYISPY